MDAGAGNLGPNTGKLVETMQAASLQPGEIDTVIITHAHPDHVGGLLDGAEQMDARERIFVAGDDDARP